MENEIERDLVDYIVGLWDQQKRFNMVKEYDGAMRFKLVRTIDGGTVLKRVNPETTKSDKESI